LSNNEHKGIGKDLGNVLYAVLMGAIVEAEIGDEWNRTK